MGKGHRPGTVGHTVGLPAGQGETDLFFEFLSLVGCGHLCCEQRIPAGLGGVLSEGWWEKLTITEHGLWGPWTLGPRQVVGSRCFSAAELGPDHQAISGVACPCGSPHSRVHPSALTRSIPPGPLVPSDHGLSVLDRNLKAQILKSRGTLS